MWGTSPARWFTMARDIPYNALMRRRMCFLLVAVAVALSQTVIATAGSFSHVGVHPDAAAQPTSTGKVLATLKGFNGKIYAGFGDYGSNTGPIGIRPFDPLTNTFGSR